MPVIHCKELEKFIKPSYSLEELGALKEFLSARGTFDFPQLDNGLFPAAILGGSATHTGYENVWVRDNFYISYCHYTIGRTETAKRNTAAIMEFFRKHRRRFQDIIDSKASASDPMNRPHVRFDGRNLEEIREKWSHAQNDALGYFLWFHSKLCEENLLKPTSEDWEMLALFVLYFEAIKFWEDEDSGHWEEARKISASSIGVVTAALSNVKKLILSQPGSIAACRYGDKQITVQLIDALIRNGMDSLEKILPFECAQEDAHKKRPYDAALLFLIYPMQIVDDKMSRTILENVTGNLQGEYGIRRYLGDSYWAPDYKQKVQPQERTVDYSDNLRERDLLLSQPGMEAQWCLFDPIVSAIHGIQFQSQRKPRLLQRQVEYFNRSLGQITGSDFDNIPPYRCPELYYLENGEYTPNDHTPLLWTQANLLIAMEALRRSLALSSPV